MASYIDSGRTAYKNLGKFLKKLKVIETSDFKKMLNSFRDLKWRRVKNKNESKKIEKEQLTSAVKKKESQLLMLQRRYHFLKDYNEVIGRDLGDLKDKIEVHNDIVKQLIFDTFDMLINDLTSFCESITQAGGLLVLMKNGTHHFKIRGPEDFEVSEPNITFDRDVSSEEEQRVKKEIKDDLVQHLVLGQQSIMDKMFPKAKNRENYEVSEKDVNLLINEFKSLYKKVKKYRDNVSAHRFERGAQKVELLTIEEVGALISETESLMNQIKVILENRSFGYSNFFYSDTKKTSEDLLDLLICGSSFHVRYRFGIKESAENGFYWQKRDEFYKTLRSTNKLKKL